MGTTKSINLVNVNISEETFKEAMKSMRDAEKESRSLSSAIKHIQRNDLWSKGYDKAFGIFGISKTMLTPANIVGALPSILKCIVRDEETGENRCVCKVWRKEYDKTTVRSKDGSKTTTKFKMYKGKKVYEWKLCEITSWNAVTLFTLLRQAVNGGAMPKYDNGLETYWASVYKAEITEAPIVCAEPIDIAVATA